MAKDTKSQTQKGAGRTTRDAGTGHPRVVVRGNLEQGKAVYVSMIDLRAAEKTEPAEVDAFSGGTAVSDAVWDDHLRELLDRRRAVYEALADK